MVASTQRYDLLFIRRRVHACVLSNRAQRGESTRRCGAATLLHASTSSSTSSPLLRPRKSRLFQLLQVYAGILGGGVQTEMAQPVCDGLQADTPPMKPCSESVAEQMNASGPQTAAGQGPNHGTPNVVCSQRLAERGAVADEQRRRTDVWAPASQVAQDRSSRARAKRQQPS
jgi:hypothetical protein